MGALSSKVRENPACAIISTRDAEFPRLWSHGDDAGLTVVDRLVSLDAVNPHVSSLVQVARTEGTDLAGAVPVRSWNRIIAAIWGRTTFKTASM